jgi:CHAT domain-containing protein
VLLEAISDSQAKSFAGIPADLLEEEKNLKSAIALCSQKLAQKPTAEEEKYLRETSFNLNRTYEAFIQRLEKQFPEYFNLKFNTSAPAIQDLQQKLGKNTALLSYFIDERNSRLYIFQITRSDYDVVTHALPKDFDRQITGMRNGIFYSEFKTYRQSAANLSSLLLPRKLPASINDLILLPTGRLSIIPFEALLTENPGENENYAAWPYWLKKYSIRYEFSAGLILQKSESTEAAKPSILLCAPVTFDEATGLASLPGTESEVKEIAQLFGNKNLTCGLYTKKNADEKLVKSGNLKNFNLLHFATHGVVDETNPELSRIFLQSEVGSEDGNLFAGEIYNLDLNARLVTLSACQTGLGKISKGEGVIGLSRALVYAGAERILVSFWSVADESTSILMKDFYQEMLDHPGQSFSESLQVSKQKLLSKKEYSSPYYWAPFVLIGF